MRYSFLFDCPVYDPAAIEYLPYTETDADIAEYFACDDHKYSPRLSDEQREKI
jgi:hypothetical protein